jgi:hypothetical protein
MRWMRWILNQGRLPAGLRREPCRRKRGEARERQDDRSRPRPATFRVDPFATSNEDRRTKCRGARTPAARSNLRCSRFDGPGESGGTFRATGWSYPGRGIPRPVEACWLANARERMVRGTQNAWESSQRVDAGAGGRQACATPRLDARPLPHGMKQRASPSAKHLTGTKQGSGVFSDKRLPAL